MAAQARQRTLFGLGEAALDPNAHPDRVQLDAGSWVDHWRHFLAGADTLFDQLVERLPWEANRRQMYERIVDVPRLTCGVDLDGGPALAPVRATLEHVSDRYAVALCGAFAAYYRDGRDSVAWHADKVDLGRPEHTTAILSLGGPRKFMVRPKGGGGSRAFVLESGDLLVLGGAVQHGWEHGVPKVAHAFPRIGLIFFSEDRAPPPAGLIPRR